MAGRRTRLSTRASKKAGGGTAAWIKKHQGTRKFEMLIHKAMRPYLIKLNKSMLSQYKKAAETFHYESYGNVQKGEKRVNIRTGTLAYRQWAQEKGRYPRAKKLGGRTVPVKAGFSAENDKFEMSGKLKKVVTNCKIKIIGTKVKILTPNSDADFKELDESKSKVNFKLSRILERKHPDAIHSKVAPRFLRGGSEYNKATMSIMNAIRIEVAKTK
tara:strand:- start:395 stop:1039 length:645 start_codon:yes stop_codon:yes gene_type:complete